MLLAIGMMVVGVVVAVSGGSVSLGPLGGMAGPALVLLALAALLLATAIGWAMMALLTRLRRCGREAERR